MGGVNVNTSPEAKTGNSNVLDIMTNFDKQMEGVYFTPIYQKPGAVITLRDVVLTWEFYHFAFVDLDHKLTITYIHSN